MKAKFRSLIFVLLAAGIALLTGNAQAADEALPPEVKALIGMKIPAKAPGRTGDIPEWKTIVGGVLGSKPNDIQEMGLEELYRDGISIFVIDLMDKRDRSRTVLDARLLPRQLLSYEIKNGKIVMKRNSSQLYSLVMGCERNRSEETIVGLMRPEPGKGNCTHNSKQVKRAWLIDPQTGRITDISPQDVSCPRVDAEYSCQ